MYRFGSAYLIASYTLIPLVSSNPNLVGRGNIVTVSEVTNKKYDFIIVGGGTAGKSFLDLDHSTGD